MADPAFALSSSSNGGPPSSKSTYPWVRLGIVALLTGIGAGFAGMSLAMLLRAVQHFSYGYSLQALISPQSFLYGVTRASPQRRLIVMTLGGAVAGLGWWAVHRFCQPLISIKKAVQNSTQPMPVIATLSHALLQIITVAMGSPLGREVAPREVGALWAGWLARYAGLDANESRLIVACGAGAGLAAVYNVPLGGAVFALEVLLGTWTSLSVVVALGISVIAALVAWIGLGNESQYTLIASLNIGLTPSLLVWSILTGPLFGFAGWAFSESTTKVRAQSPTKGARLILGCVLNFAILGALASLWPALLGNGRGPTQLSFDADVSLQLAVALLVLKLLAIHATLRTGAQGGLLTPGMTIGALMAVILGSLWCMVWPGGTLAAFAIVGAAAFLATSMAMPITAVVLVAEFTRIDHTMLFPVICAVVGSVVTAQGCRNKAAQRP